MTEGRVFRAKTAKFERIVRSQVASWPPVRAEMAIGLARVMDGAIRTDQPKLFLETADRLERMLSREGGGSGDSAGGVEVGGLAGVLGAGPSVRNAADLEPGDVRPGGGSDQ